MSVLSNVTVKTLKKNRVRTIVTIIGIILSTAMFTAVASIITSLHDFAIRGAIENGGNYHAFLEGCDAGTIEEISGDERVSLSAWTEYLGYANIGSANEDKPYICVIGANDAFFDNMPVKLIEGRLPENENEIVVSEHLDYNGGVKLDIGETVELKLGERRTLGAAAYQNAPYAGENGEEFIETKTARFTVVGIIKRPSFEGYSAPGYTAIARKNALDGGAAYRYYFRVASPSKNLEPMLEERGLITEAGINNELLALEGAISNDSFKKTLISLGAILCALIFAGSVSLIYSAFAISVSERTKQFGILSSVGATKKQLRSTVFHEAFVLALIGVPIGIAAGLLGTGLTLHFLKDIIAATGTNSFDGVALRLSVNPYTLIAPALLSIVTVLVSAWIPSKRAMRISPLEAIRQTRDVAVKGRQPRTSKLFLKLFGAEGMLSRNYYHRSKKKYRATVFSLVMSLVLFITASAFSMYLKKSFSISDLVGDGSNYDLMYFFGMSYSEFESVRPALESFTDEVNSVIGEGGESFFLADESALTPEYAKASASHGSGDQALFSPNAQVYYIDDAYFEKLTAKLGLDMKDFTDPENRTALVVNVCRQVQYTQAGQIDKISSFGAFKNGAESLLLANCADYYKEGQFTEVRWSGGRFGSGEPVAFSTPNSEEAEQGDASEPDPAGGTSQPLEFKRVRIGALLDTAPLGLRRYMDAHQGIQLAFPLSMLEGEYGEQKVLVNMLCSDSSAAAVEFRDRLGERGIKFNPSSLYDAHENERMIDGLVTVMDVFTYGFIVLITLISAANVFNTITTNVALRRRDYAMLRSMGMTKRGMNRMMNYECLLYGSKALLIGLPIAFVLTYLIYRALGIMTVLRFELPWAAIGIAVAGIFIVVFTSMLYQTNRIKKDNPIDSLRNENI